MSLKDTFLIKEGDVIQFPGGGGGKPPEDPEQLVTWLLMNVEKASHELRQVQRDYQQAGAEPIPTFERVKKIVDDLELEVSETGRKLGK